MQLQQAAEAAEKRRAQLAQDRDEADRARVERGASAARGDRARDRRPAIAAARRDRARATPRGTRRNEAEVALARGRERLRAAERAAQEAALRRAQLRATGSPSSSAGAKRSPRRSQQQQGAARAADRRARGDRLDAGRGGAAAPARRARRRRSRRSPPRATRSKRSAPSCAPPRRRGSRPSRSSIPRARRSRTCSSRSRPRRSPRQQFAEQLAEAHADVAALPEALKAWGSASHAARRDRAAARTRSPSSARSTWPRSTSSRRRSERKDYLDRQAADLTEAMTTLEAAIRQIDRESRELLQQTFDAVNANFGKLFPMLFGGGAGAARADRRGDPRFGRAGDRAAAGQAQHVDPSACRAARRRSRRSSLVFALFQLNPAPFCLLDEVDAPLDDPQHRPLLRDGAARCRRRRSSCSSRTTRSRWRWRNQLDRHHDARAGHLARRRGRHRRGARARGETRARRRLRA